MSEYNPVDPRAVRGKNLRESIFGRQRRAEVAAQKKPEQILPVTDKAGIEHEIELERPRGENLKFFSPDEVRELRARIAAVRQEENAKVGNESGAHDGVGFWDRVRKFFKFD